MKKEKILITAALPYTNHVPHVGHIVGSHLPADIFYKYCKLAGHDAKFIGGSDEHGTPILMSSRKNNVSTQEFTDRMHEIHKEIYNWFEIDYSNYSRTSREVHHRTTKDFFNKINERGYIKSNTIQQYYCEKDEMFLPDRFVKGKCTSCGYEDANGDQCEKCGKVINTYDLTEPSCTNCNNEPVIKESDHLFLDLKKIEPKLKKWLKSREKVFNKQTLNEGLKWINEGLRERGITRDLEWGVKVPLGGFEDKVFYVWFDAPIGYISSSLEEDGRNFDKYWKGKNNKAKIFNFLGKDNIPFHTVFWPAMQLAHGDINLAHNVVGLQYLNFKDEKISKSKGHGVFCDKLKETGINPDLLRSYLTTVIPENKDSNFRWEDFQTHVNSELIGKIGNYFNRVIAMTNKYFCGNLNFGKENISDLEHKIFKDIKSYPKAIGKSFYKAKFRDAYKQILEYATVANQYISENAPWELIKTDEKKTKEVLYVGLNLAKSLAIVSSPIISSSSRKFMKEQLNLESELNYWNNASQISIPSIHNLGKEEPLFSRITDEEVEHLREYTSHSREIKDYF